MTDYLKVEEVILINVRLVGQQAQLRDRGLLESAVARPQTSAFGEDAYPTIYEKAATVATVTFLRLNGLLATWNFDDALAFILGVVEEHKTIEDIVVWLRENTQAF